MIFYMSFIKGFLFFPNSNVDIFAFVVIYERGLQVNSLLSNLSRFLKKAI